MPYLIKFQNSGTHNQDWLLAPHPSIWCLPNNNQNGNAGFNLNPNNATTFYSFNRTESWIINIRVTVNNSNLGALAYFAALNYTPPNWNLVNITTPNLFILQQDNTFILPLLTISCLA
ncbi:hypothetical protein [Clostridium felsineum]|uniref:Uncharacterized protein n=1 Tax=Clostridium felsineum TaxID=36839 RepID=A0A1S8M7D0_9CLOT|nr:hypothetical protein [Clostridium felsineum]MCR3760966.1 hypothetical protein [Clostridium felsineum]URZ05250.1 hypothetical protein CLROS_005740 [Clostridium felsineum]URZ10291.1 hypothetical protein CROST_009990 [Clostridium felsineum]